MTSYERSRTKSQYEESNIDSFVESCVQFKTNLSFFTTSEGKSIANDVQNSTGGKPKLVLLIGTAKQLSDKNLLQNFFPYYNDQVEEAIPVATDGSCYLVYRRPQFNLVIAKVPSVASRHNCPARPDTISTLIADSLRSYGTESGTDIYCLGDAQFQLCITCAISRASNNLFSAKKGAAERGYIDRAPPVRVVFSNITDPQKFSGNATNKSLSVASTMVQLCQLLIDAPTNLLDTVTFTEIADKYVSNLKKSGLNVNIKIIKGEELREEGYGGLYGTGKAAEFPPHMVILSYTPPANLDPTERIAFVGKGVVYDTGGLSIKPGASMCTMKRDMGGAAAVFCGFLGLAMLNAPVEASCILCLADNAVGPRAQRNDDIIRMKSGITVEINNTDAEGRLVLSDGVFHASELLPYTPNIIVDMATLTGAQGVATGQHHAAIFANTELGEKRIQEAGTLSGDLCFPVIYCPEFHNGEFDSTVADFRNSVANRSNAQVSCAGQFIGNHLSPRYSGHWIHVDLASPSAKKRATGFGVGLILQTFAKNLF